MPFAEIIKYGNCPLSENELMHLNYPVLLTIHYLYAVQGSLVPVIFADGAAYILFQCILRLSI